MRPNYATYTTTGAKETIPVDWYISNFQITLGVEILSGACTYTVEFTVSDIYDSTITPVWFSHPSLTSQTTSNVSNLAFPVRGVRLNISSITGSTRFAVLAASQS
jgi:hypothetical protein